MSSAHCKKSLTIFPFPASMVLTKLSLPGNILIFPDQGEFGKWLDSRLGTGKSLTLFYSAGNHTAGVQNDKSR
jgi:hypothetical protein